MSILEWLFFLFLSFYLSILFFKFKISEVISIFSLVTYHFIFSYIFFEFSKDKTNDSYNYFLWAKESLELEYQGTGIIIRIIKLLNFIGFNDYSTIFLFFTSISAIAIVGFYKLIYRDYYSLNMKIIIFILVLIPGLHFWTVAIGKDSLTLFSIFLVCYGANNRKFGISILGSLIILFIRYHIFGILIGSLIIYLLFFSNYKPKVISKTVFRLIIIVVSSPVAVTFFYGLMKNIQKYSSDGFNDIGSFINNRQDAYSDVGSGVLLSGQPYIVKVFALIFGGIPWLSIDLLSLFSMLEGIVILVTLYFSLSLLYKNRHQNNYFYNVSFYFFIFIFIFLLFMPLISANLGIMARMRVIFYLPLFLIFTNLTNRLELSRHVNEKIPHHR